MADEKAVHIDGVDRQNRDEITVSFTDGTSATFTVEDLLQLKPVRGTSGGDEADD